jgi:hypothetical protein
MLRQQPTPAAMYLKMSHLETARRRNDSEVARAEARILSLRGQFDEIVREQTSLKAALERIDQQGPTRLRPVVRASCSAADVAPVRIGLSIKY